MYAELTTPNGRRIKAVEIEETFPYENIRIVTDETGRRHVVSNKPPRAKKPKIDHSVCLTTEIIASFNESKTIVENLLMYREKTGASSKSMAMKFDLTAATINIYLKGELPGLIGIKKLQKTIGFSDDYAKAHTKPPQPSRQPAGPPRNKLRQLRKALGKSQAEVARELDMSSNYISHLERGEPKNNAAWQRLADYYGTTIAELTEATHD